MASTLSAGHGRERITPSLSVPHGGWGAQTHLLADGVHMDLYVDVLILQQDDDAATALVSFDLVGLYGLEVDVRQTVARETGLAPEQVRVTVTHNHANPVMWPNWVGARKEQVDAYRAALPDLAAGAARAAKLAMQPVRMEADWGHCTIGRNRRQLDGERMIVGRDDAGPTDPQVLVVRLDDLDGRPVAALMGYTCHPTTMGPDNRMVSPDYPGVAKRVFEAAVGVPCLFLQGATGNVGPEMGFTGDLAVVERLGSVLGLEAAKVFSGLRTRPVEPVYLRPRESGATLAVWEERPLPEPEKRLKVAQHTITLPLRPQPGLDQVEAAYEQRRAELASAYADGLPAEQIEATMFRARRAGMAVSRVKTYGGRASLDVPLELLSFGSLAIAGISGEPFCQIGLAIKAGSPFEHTFFGGYTGASLGYIPTAADHPLGGYEVETTPYTVEGADIIVRETVAALRDLAEA